MSTISDEIKLFILLRQKVVGVFRSKYPTTSVALGTWSGQDIVRFQEDLQEIVNTSISEKWFYTYFKQEDVSKLPRIDMLNLLSEYVGEENWASFMVKNKIEEVPSLFSKGKLKIAAVIGVGLLLAFLSSQFYPKEINYNFCFVDEDIQMPITTALQVKVLKDGESPIYFSTAENGCFSYTTKEKNIQFEVSSPYYKGETIFRKYPGIDVVENVNLVADEYALILHYFSSNNIDDWKTRRQELAKMIHPDAVIYQVFGKEAFGIDILSKDAFINKITLPTSSLRNMKIIEIERESNQIVKLKFETILEYE